MNTKQQARAMAPVIVAFVIMAVPALRTIMDTPGTIVIVRADLQDCIVSFNSFNPSYILCFIKISLNSYHYTTMTIVAKEQICSSAQCLSNMYKATETNSLFIRT